MILNEYADLISKNQVSIVDRWTEKVRVCVPAALHQERHELIDSMPLVLIGLAAVLSQSTSQSEVKKMESDIARVHGLTRAQQTGYSPQSIDHEYRELSGIIFDVLRRQGEIPRQVRELILDITESASQDAQKSFIRARAAWATPATENWHLSEVCYRMIVEEVDEYAIFMVDPAGHIASWNKGTLKIKGYRPQEILGLPFRMLFTDEDAALGRPEWELGYAEKHGRYAGEGWRQRKDGTRFWASVVLTALRGQDGKLVGWCKITRDLTVERRAEEELRKAEAATRAKSAFLANMSHEIRTPLGAIIGFADLLQNPDLPTAHRLEFAATVKRNGEQLTALIDDILDLSKVEAGKLSVERGPFAMSEFIDDIHSTLEHSAVSKGIEFALLYPNGIPPNVVSDRLRLRQILLNIIGNAIKFTDQGFVRVEIEFRPATESAAQDQIRFTVTDSGMGIAAESQKRLFEPFTQAHNGESRLYGGTGLGLVLSRELARALGGDVVLVESNLGEGSCFAIQVDAGPKMAQSWIEDPSHQMKPVRHAGTAFPEAKHLTGVRVLLAEDAADNRRLISFFLRSAGAQVDMVEDGQAAVDAARQGRHDLILMDIQMPEMDGYQATSLLRHEGFEQPIVALTAFAMKDERARSRDSGFTEYLTKPINRDALLKTIADLTGTFRDSTQDSVNRSAADKPELSAPSTLH